MIKIFKGLFDIKRKKYVSDIPGRIFKRIDTGMYFGFKNTNIDESIVTREKQRQIDQIAKLALLPVSIKYYYKGRRGSQTEDHEVIEALHAYLVFQKEVFAEKWNMIHITEISFIVNHFDFNEFEKMSGFRLSKDFNTLTPME